MHVTPLRLARWRCRLWEELPAAVMGAALELHHAALRRAAAAYGGYASAGEGDSLILAFHT